MLNIHVCVWVQSRHKTSSHFRLHDFAYTCMCPKNWSVKGDTVINFTDYTDQVVPTYNVLIYQCESFKSVFLLLFEGNLNVHCFCSFIYVRRLFWTTVLLWWNYLNDKIYGNLLIFEMQNCKNENKSDICLK